MPPAAGTARATIRQHVGTQKLTAINDAANVLTQLILKSTPAGKDQTNAVRLIAEAVVAATSGIMYNGA